MSTMSSLRRVLDAAIVAALLLVVYAGVTAHSRRDPSRIVKSASRAIALVNLRHEDIENLKHGATIFIDYTCPHSRALLADLDGMSSRSAGSVKVRHFPLNDGVARESALLGICADSLSSKPRIEQVLRSGNALDSAAIWKAVSDAVGEDDRARLSSCVNGRGAQTQLANDLRLAYDLGVSKSPSVALRDRLISGRPSEILLRAILYP